MPRPRKCRKVCCLPKSNLFGPINKVNIEHETIIMTVDEYETIRLMDLEGMMQEECAKKMDVARTTVQRIYNEARLKLAKALVNGALLKIEGGDFQLCEDVEIGCKCKSCHKKKCCEE
ncbi:DUF134 domain-containing protein [Clostridium sp.]|uniref:DUF134 domain-containing protein n=1 Tax=Clostridium sp. TaxID=1506 RepID=UPI002FCAA018